MIQNNFSCIVGPEAKNYMLSDLRVIYFQPVLLKAYLRHASPEALKSSGKALHLGSNVCASLKMSSILNRAVLNK